MPLYHRRDVLKIGALAAAAGLMPLPALAAVPRHRASDRRVLSFYNTHTAEALRACYFENGAYRPDVLKKINYVLRDYRTNEILPIDTQLLDLLHAIQGQLDCTDPFHVISGYRSPATNEMLRRTTSGVAKKSLHTRGKAIDIRLPRCPTSKLHRVCLGMRAGGVGYYKRSDFVHVDTGRVRSW
jgi:uncharacterized protein YcbK (DUF882 family)